MYGSNAVTKFVIKVKNRVNMYLVFCILGLAKNFLQFFFKVKIKKYFFISPRTLLNSVPFKQRHYFAI